ncbi:MAG: helix-turn-helix domain-containing protein [Candidatus Saccharibacteria bacterium]|nr:helix-turn-helix domain-containing protein [Moraxellaceae bacterium]
MDAEMSKFTADLLQSVREMNADVRARETKVNISDVIEARHKTGLSQQQFANILHISKRTLQDWEQGRREPSGAAQSLIRIALSRPDVIAEVLA